MLNRNGHTVRLVAMFLALFVVLAVGFRPTAAQAATTSGDVEEFTIGDLDFKGTLGFTCDGAMWWLSTDAGVSTANYTIKCQRGSLGDGLDVAIRIESGDCSGGNVYLGDIDEAANQKQSGQIVTCAAGDSTPVITELCHQTRTHVWLGDEIWSRWDCQPFALGGPPAAPDPANLPVEGVAACPRGQLLTPWVSGPTARGVAGNWRWELDITFRVGEMNSRTGGSLTIEGVQPYLHAYVAYRDGGLDNDFSVLSPAGHPLYKMSTGIDTAVFALDNPSAPVNSVKIRVTGNTRTGAVGSAPYAPILFSAGYFPARTFGSSVANNALESFPSGVVTGTWWNDANSRAVRYAGHNRASWCYAAWGAPWANTSDTTGEAVPLGPLDLRPTDTDPPPLVVVVPPPVVDVGPDCPPGTTVCVEPTPDAEDPVLPDPDGEECDFEFDDPSTWGGQLVCAMVRLFSILYSLVETVIAVLNLILSTLGDLLIPSEDLWGDTLEEFDELWAASTLSDWQDALGGLVPDDPGSSSCEGPTFGPVEIIDGAEVPQMRPFDACGDRAATAGMVRGVLMVAATFAGAWRIWDMAVGSVGGYRGGGRHMSDSEFL